jgi:hypothetical protein
LRRLHTGNTRSGIASGNGGLLGLLRRLHTGNTRSGIASGNGGIGSDLSIPQARHVYEVTDLGRTGGEIELHLDFLYPGSGLKDR